jgi:hypothetical protein
VGLGIRCFLAPKTFIVNFATALSGMEMSSWHIKLLILAVVSLFGAD